MEDTLLSSFNLSSCGLQQAKDTFNSTLQLLWSDTLAQVVISPISNEVTVIFTKNVRAILTNLIFPNNIKQK